MSKLSTAIRLIRTNRGVFLASVLENLNFLFPDKLYLQLLFRCKMGYWMDLENPKSFSEKLQWLKLYNRNPLYTTLVDKYAVKTWVANEIGEEYIIPTLGVWDRFDEIDFCKLPKQFVLKCTHDSGGLVICKNKGTFDVESSKRIINKSLKANYYGLYREWPYKNVRPKIIAEAYMEDKCGELKDYKFFCFNGVVNALFIASDRQNENEETKFDFFDRNFKHLPFTNGHPNSEDLPPKPTKFEDMVVIAEILSKGMPHVRIDLYEIDGKIYFGEMTFFHWSGFTPFNPKSWDYKFGDWLLLPKEKNQ